MPVSINDNSGSEVRLCGLKISTDGEEHPYPISASVHHNRYAAASTFTAKFVLNGSKFDIAWWGSMDRVDDFPMEIQYGCGDPTAGLDGIPWQTMITGQVDKIALDIKKGIVTVWGRDNWAYFIETYTLNKFQSHTVNDVMQEICDDLEFNYVSQQSNNPDAMKLFREYGIITAGGAFTHLVNYANLVDFLASKSNAFAFFEGDTLYLRDYTDIDGTWDVILTPPSDDGPVIDFPDSNTENIIFERDLNIARNTSVEVDNWNAQTNKPIAVKDDQSKFRPGFGATIHILRPGVKDEEEARHIANTEYDRRIRHEKKMIWTQPGDLYLTVLYKAVLVGGGTDWHQEYWIESLERTMSKRTGFKMSCIGTNADPALANDEAY